MFRFIAYAVIIPTAVAALVLHLRGVGRKLRRYNEDIFNLKVRSSGLQSEITELNLARTDDRLLSNERFRNMAKNQQDILDDIEKLKTDAANVVTYVQAAQTQITDLKELVAKQQQEGVPIDLDAIDEALSGVHATLSSAVMASPVPAEEQPESEGSGTIPGGPFD